MRTETTQTRLTGRVLAAATMMAVAGCGTPHSSPAETAVDAVSDESYLPIVPLANEEFSIVEMATAHGAFTLEVEVDRNADTRSIARRLVEPVRNRYAEVLVYFYDRAGRGALPTSRVQWTAENGYSEIEY